MIVKEGSMKEIFSQIRDLKAIDFWVHPDRELEIVNRLLIIFAGCSLLVLPVFFFTPSDASTNSLLLPFLLGSWVYLVLGAFAKIAVVVALKVKSPYGWIGLVIIASQSIFTAFMPIAIVAVVWICRPEMRIKFPSLLPSDG